MKRIEIDGTLPFLAPGSAMFLGCEDPASTTPAGLKASQYAACFFELQRELRLLGYRYLYVPELLGSISSDAVSYMFPGCEMPSPSAVYSNVRSRLGLGADVCGFLLNDYGSLSLLPVNIRQTFHPLFLRKSSLTSGRRPLSGKSPTFRDVMA